jgi:hypothetical protein
MTISILKAESFQPLGPAIKRASKPAPDPVQVRPGVFQGTDGRMFTDFATGQSVAPAPKASPPAPEAAAAPAAALDDGWIDCSPDMPDLPAGTYEQRWKGDSKGLLVSHFSAHRNFLPTAWSNYQYRLIPTEAA